MAEVDDFLHDLIKSEDDALLEIADGDVEHIFSERYNQKMRELYQWTGKSRRVKMRFPVKIFFVAAIVVIFLGGITAGAYWEQIMQFFTTQYEDYTDLSITSQNTASNLNIGKEPPADWKDVWIPEYIPEGFLADRFAGGTRVKTITYTSTDDTYIEFRQLDKIVGIDGEVTNIEGINIDGFQAYAYEKNFEGKTIRNLSWSNGEESFSIEGTPPMDELVKIAESITYYVGG